MIFDPALRAIPTNPINPLPNKMTAAGTGMGAKLQPAPPTPQICSWPLANNTALPTSERTLESVPTRAWASKMVNTLSREPCSPPPEKLPFKVPPTPNFVVNEAGLLASRRISDPGPVAGPIVLRQLVILVLAGMTLLLLPDAMVSAAFNVEATLMKVFSCVVP